MDPALLEGNAQFSFSTNRRKKAARQSSAAARNRALKIKGPRRDILPLPDRVREDTKRNKNTSGDAGDVLETSLVPSGARPTSITGRSRSFRATLRRTGTDLRGKYTGK